MKKVWVTSLTHNENCVKDLMAILKPYRIVVDGHFWIDDMAKMAWAASSDSLIDWETGLWVIIADELSWSNKSILKGLSCLAFTAHARRQEQLPILILFEDNNIIDQKPTALSHARILSVKASGLGAKITALLNLSHPDKQTDYRINFYPLHQLGLWVEVGPVTTKWSGMILGVNGGEINFQAHGPQGTLPEKSVLEYPQQGLKVVHSEFEFTAWGIQNIIDTKLSYFARISEVPEQMLFTSYTQNNETDAYIVKFC